MAHIVLVHGMSAKGGSWFDIPKGLEQAGHEVTTLTLPGHQGDVNKPGPQPFTVMANYVAAVKSALSKTEKSVLIGHSMGGMVISQTVASLLSDPALTDEEKDRVSKLIYVTAALPNDGQSLFDAIGADTPDKKAAVAAAAVAEFLALGLTDEEKAEVLGSQPFGPLLEPFVSGGGFEEFPKAYVICKDDNVIQQSEQERMINDYGLVEVASIDAGHIPQHTAPAALLAALLAMIP